MKKIIRNVLAVFAILFIALSCVSEANYAARPISKVNQCEAGCLNLEKLGCNEGKPLLTPWECETSSECPEEQNECINGYCGVTCVKFCEDTLKNGKDLNPACWSKINKCSKIETCQVVQ